MSYTYWSGPYQPGSSYGTAFTYPYSGYASSGYGTGNTPASPPAANQSFMFTTTAPQTVQIQTQAIQTPDFTPITPPTLTGNTEAVTVNAATPGGTYNIGTQGFSAGGVSPSFTPSEFLPALTPADSPPVEAVTVEATRTPPAATYQIQTQLFNWQSPAMTPEMYLPDFAPAYDKPAQQKNQQRASPGGGAGGGGSKPATPPPQPPQAPKLPQQQQQVTPQQKQQLAAMTPEQLKQLLNNPNLTPAQRQAVQNALAAKTGGGGAAASPKTAANGAVASASPLQPAAFVLPALIGLGVATAWGLSHKHEVTAKVRAVRKRVRKVMG